MNLQRNALLIIKKEIFFGVIVILVHVIPKFIHFE